MTRCCPTWPPTPSGPAARGGDHRPYPGGCDEGTAARTRLNNTDPLAAPDAPRRETLTVHGAEVAEDGQLFEL